MRSREQDRASTLAGAVCVIAVALLAVLTVGTASSVNVQMLARSENAQNASLLADSAIQQALAQLMNDPTWGDSPNTRIQYAGPSEDSDVLLTFDRAAGVPFCTKNGDDNPKPAWSESKLLRGGLVPGKRMHLVAVARSHNVRRTREAVVYVPNFTLSLGATGKFHLIDSVVGCLDTAQGIDLDAIASDPSKLKPGDLGTITYNGKTIPAVFGDVGPKNKIGEVSRYAAQQLGINASPTSGGVNSGVSYRVFPGSGNGRPSPASVTPQALAQRVTNHQTMLAQKGGSNNHTQVASSSKPSSSKHA